MRKFILPSVICAASIFNFACSSETHYDSVSTTFKVDLAKAIESSNKVTLHHRFTFDRDLAPLQSVELVEAWIEESMAPDQENSVGGGTCDLGIIRDIDISIVDQINGSKVYWLYVEPDSSTLEKALFSELNVGDLRQYMSSTMTFEIEVTVTLHDYHAVRYWRDECNMDETCNVQLPFSMYFKMED